MPDTPYALPRRAVMVSLLATSVLLSGRSWAMASGKTSKTLPDIAGLVGAVNAKVIAWRRDIHAHPELGNMEVRTADIVARHLQSLGLDSVRTKVAHTGVIGVLKGKLPGKGIVALRADMDALPIKEQTGLPFASKIVVDVKGVTTPVMHACGHDAHTAMLMGAAEVLAKLRDQFAGTILFVFQPAEEGVDGELAGAQLMLQERAFEDIEPNAMFALHVEPGRVGEIDARPGPMLSSATNLFISLKGAQTHAGRPWEGTDLVNLSADIVKSLNTVAARQVNVFEYPNVVSIGSLQAGNRANILPGSASLVGTIRTFDLARRDELKRRISELVTSLAIPYGAEANVRFEDVALTTGNDPAILDIAMPALIAAAGPGGGVRKNALMRGAAEDFSYFQARYPGLFYILGSSKNFTSMKDTFPNHSDRFDIDEAVLPIGVKAHALTALAYLAELNRKG